MLIMVDIVSYLVLGRFSASVKSAKRLLRCQHSGHVYFVPDAAERLVELVDVLFSTGVLSESRLLHVQA